MFVAKADIEATEFFYNRLIDSLCDNIVKCEKNEEYHKCAILKKGVINLIDRRNKEKNELIKSYIQESLETE